MRPPTFPSTSSLHHAINLQQEHPKINTKGNIYDRLIFTKLMTIPFTTTHAKVVIAIKGKYILQYPFQMKNHLNTRNPKFFFVSFTMTTSMTLRRATHLKKAIEQLVARGHLYYFMRRKSSQS